MYRKEPKIFGANDYLQAVHQFFKQKESTNKHLQT